MFDVHYQPSANLIESTLSGFLSLHTVKDYAAKVEPIIERAAKWSQGYVILIDVSGCSIQSQEVIASFQRHVAGVPLAQACAVVTGSSIIRMQIKRIVSGPVMRIFEDRMEALGWLISDRKLLPAATPAPDASVIAHGRCIG